jgi:hypothetical protein
METLIAIWNILPPQYQIAATVGVPMLGIVATFIVKRTKTKADDRLLAKAKGIWTKLRGKQAQP